MVSYARDNRIFPDSAAMTNIKRSYEEVCARDLLGLPETVRVALAVIGNGLAGYHVGRIGPETPAEQEKRVVDDRDVVVFGVGYWLAKRAGKDRVHARAYTDQLLPLVNLYYPLKLVHPDAS